MMTLLGIVVLACAWRMRPWKWPASGLDPDRAREDSEALVGWVVLVGLGVALLAVPWL